MTCSSSANLAWCYCESSVDSLSFLIVHYEGGNIKYVWIVGFYLLEIYIALLTDRWLLIEPMMVMGDGCTKNYDPG